LRLVKWALAIPMIGMGLVAVAAPIAIAVLLVRSGKLVPAIIGVLTGALYLFLMTRRRREAPGAAN
jgi:hypothetical protein